jgi:NitT/TauT family transport system substrate-binding protein
MPATVHLSWSRPARLLAGTAAATAVLAGCGGSPDAGPGGTTTVAVGVIPILDVAPLYLGIQQGFFTQQGLTLKLESAQGGAAIVPGVVSKQFQFGFSNTTSLIVATSKGLPLKVVSAGVASTGTAGKDFGAVVVKADSPIRTAADLAGRKVAVNTLRNINTTTVDKAVRDAGADPAKVSFVELAFPDIPAAIANGNVDAGQVVEPFLTIAKQQGMREISSNYAATAPDLMVGMYFTSAAYAQQNPETVTKFSAAMRQSLQYANANPDAARAVLGTYLKIDPAVRQAVTLPKWPTDIPRDSVTVLAGLAQQDKLITAMPDLSALLP